MSRSVKKGPFVQKVLYDRIEAMNKAGEKKVIKTWSRASTIFPEFVGHTIAVYDGRKHVPVYVDDPVDVGNLVSGSSAFSKTSLNNWKFTVHVLLKPGLENFDHYFTSV